MAEEKKPADIAVTDVREGLLLAGIAEVEENGLQGFSLRRAATVCGVSCAAPYKHFKNKDEYILAILRYINEKWHLFEEHIAARKDLDARQMLIEACIANIRFWIGNPHFRSVRLMDTRRLSEEQKQEIHQTEPSACLFAAYAAKACLDESVAQSRLFAVRALLWGGILLAAEQEQDPIPHLRQALERQL